MIFNVSLLQAFKVTPGENQARVWEWRGEVKVGVKVFCTGRLGNIYGGCGISSHPASLCAE